MPYADQWLSNSFPGRLEPAALKEHYSLFLVVIDYFKSLFALSSTSQREVVVYS